MSIVYRMGDLLAEGNNIHYICHQVNCQGKMGSGIAKQIRAKYPIVYEKYKKEIEDNGAQAVYGTILPIDVDGCTCIVNMFSQFNYGYDGKRYTSYDAFWNCLNELKELVDIEAFPQVKAIGFPKGIGCGLGGANWAVIHKMIETVFSNPKYCVYIYDNLGGTI